MLLFAALPTLIFPDDIFKIFLKTFCYKTFYFITRNIRHQCQRKRRLKVNSRSFSLYAIIAPGIPSSDFRLLTFPFSVINLNWCLWKTIETLRYVDATVTRTSKEKRTKKQSKTKKQTNNRFRIKTLLVHHTFLHISPPFLHDSTTWSCLILRFMADVNKRRRNDY